MPEFATTARPFAEAIFVRLFRVWSAARQNGDITRNLHEAAERFDLSPQQADLCSGLFQMVEDRLGRELQPECCCARNFSRDEAAMIVLLNKVQLANICDPLDRTALAVCKALGLDENGSADVSAPIRSDATRNKIRPAHNPRPYCKASVSAHHGL